MPSIVWLTGSANNTVISSLFTKPALAAMPALALAAARSGEHGCRIPEDALAVMRSMATRWWDEDIAASLNRMGMPTDQREEWRMANHV